ncbi:unnamed protein product [Linum tenue]|uniref:Uncharacterized protein n=1 Tax=Linum tenue TaxID=586396 RepID=A0AAV0L3W0_9ROSI|nr:unnamed protein product [Linum tenue]
MASSRKLTSSPFCVTSTSLSSCSPLPAASAISPASEGLLIVMKSLSYFILFYFVTS